MERVFIAVLRYYIFKYVLRREYQTVSVVWG